MDVEHNEKRVEETMQFDPKFTIAKSTDVRIYVE
jgi:hypothetical protein